MPRLPLIGIPADRRLCGDHYFHMVGEKYIEAVADGANALPVLVPALGPELDLPSLLQVCDGLLLTGSASNVNHTTTEDRRVRRERYMTQIGMLRRFR